jgi:hypothetical protein
MKNLTRREEPVETDERTDEESTHIE